jgi:FkbM family methyltransferase
MDDIEIEKIQRRIIDLYGIMALYQSLKNISYNTAVNVGSFTGRYSNVYAKLFNCVISFDPSTHPDINKHKSHNEVFVNKALYSTKKLLDFYQFPESGYDTLTSSFIDMNPTLLEKYSPTVTTVETCTLDEFKFSNQIDFIKIDAEGADGHVILGAQETIKRCRPVVQVESMYNCQEAIDFLTENNYVKFKDNGIFLNYDNYRDDVWIPEEKL